MGMSRIFWDSNLFIYLFEGQGQLNKRVIELRRAMLKRGDQLVTSAFTLGEILVKPLEQEEVELARKLEEAVTSHCLIVSFDVRAARVYASLRRDRTLRPPDAIQLACAAAIGVDLFITNDFRLQGKRVEGIQFISSLEQAPL
jgi:predicted nucleic acid-binding protein